MTALDRLMGYRGFAYAGEAGIVLVPYFEIMTDLNNTLTLREAKRRLMTPEGAMWVLPGEVEL